MAKKKNKQTAVAVRVPDVVIEWENYMGKGDLEDFQRLMMHLGFEEHFPSKTSCRKALKTVWVNIPDFLQCVREGRPVHHFENQTQLAQYTVHNRRYFPRRNIDKKSPLKQLLAHIMFNQGRKSNGGDSLVARMGGLSLVGV
ncbi:hypothetical protein F4808DRAFT_392666 [Astrocystis sublimbata]|nr:hypothetical protein F4808DRAFT_392666 [Astrocystis sublimbata]